VEKEEDEYIASALKYVALASSSSSSENESDADDVSMPDMMEEPPPKRQSIATPSLAAVLDRTERFPCSCV